MLKESGKEFDNERKLLLLGPGDAGKSTFVRQMKLIHLNGYSDEELLEHRPYIVANVVTTVRSIIEGAEKLQINIEAMTNEFAQYFLENSTIGHDELIGRVDEIKSFWKDAGVKKAIARCSEFQLPSSSYYWFENLDRIVHEEYVPTPADLLRLRVKTTGIVETFFSVNSKYIFTTLHLTPFDRCWFSFGRRWRSTK